MEQVRSLPGLLVLLAVINIRYNVSLQIDLTTSPAASLDQVSPDIIYRLEHSHWSRFSRYCALIGRTLVSAIPTHLKTSKIPLTRA